MNKSSMVRAMPLVTLRPCSLCWLSKVRRLGNEGNIESVCWAQGNDCALESTAPQGLLKAGDGWNPRFEIIGRMIL